MTLSRRSLESPVRFAFARSIGAICRLTVALALMGTVQAATQTWQNLGTDWNTAANWSGSVPNANDGTVFPTVGNPNPTLSSANTARGVLFQGTGYNIQGVGAQTLTLTSGGGVLAIVGSNLTGTNTISVGLDFAGSTQVIGQAGSGTLILSGAMTSTTTTSITYNGLGLVNLTGNAKAYTAATVITNGTLKVSNGASLTGTSSVAVNTGVTAGGTLLLDSSANSIVPITGGGGGTISVAGATDTDQSLGALTLTAGSTTVDFGALAGETLRFANSAGLWTAGTTLNVINYTIGSDHLFFGSVTSAGLNSGQLAQISFFSGPGTGFIGNGNFAPNGEVSPIPEPSSVAVGLGLLGMIGIRERRRVGLILGRW